MSSKPGSVRVWDLPVRVLHILLIAGFFGAWLTRHVRGPWHEWLGYGVLAVITVRLLWGFVGSRYARFSQFVRAPGATWRYTRSTVSGTQPRFLGHNPLGAWMILALLCTILGICVSGWLYTTDRYWGVEWVEELHDTLTNIGLGLISLHVAGVLFGSWHDRENLIGAMLHGRKRPPQDGDIA